MNSRRGSFHGSWSWLSNFPSFFGFIPSSRAICTCSCDRWNLRRASIQGCKFAGIRGCFFAIDTSAHTDRFATNFGCKEQVGQHRKDREQVHKGGASMIGSAARIPTSILLFSAPGAWKSSIDVGCWHDSADPGLPKHFSARTERWKLCGKSSCHFRQGCTPFVRHRIWCIKLWTSFFHQMLSLEILHERIHRYARNSQHICHV